MNTEAEGRSFAVDRENLPAFFPTHQHSPEFWEHLGRAVATFGFLEEVLGKAIFAFTATTRYEESELEEAYEKWLPTLERALIDQLGCLIEQYGKSVRNNQSTTIENINDLLNDLRSASVIRNVLCHGSWRIPDAVGKSLPFFVNKKKEKFQTLIDVVFLKQTQRHAVELACAVMDTVTRMGLQFPGSNGPGRPIL